MGRFTDYKVQQFLNSFNRVWISLHHENPDVSSPIASEITGGDYERAEVLFGDPNGRYVQSITQARFSGLPAVRVTHLGGWSKQYGGEMDFYIDFSEPMRLKLGQTVNIQAGKIVISID